MEKEKQESVLRAMNRALSHRGPDDEGFYFGKQIALGHKRLSIIDLSPAGHQPMRNEAGNLWVTFNGEIYNFIELKQELKELGHRFKSNSDTEVILHAFEEWGEECQDRFNGMWALAIWDTKTNALFCSRDRFGVKPFYYFFDGKIFAFASEIKALLTCPFIKREPDEKSIYNFLVLSLTDYSQNTFFKGIKQLEPGECLALKNNQLAAKKYYQLPFNSDFGSFEEKEFQKASQKFIELLEDSVRLRFRSDTEVGACLSGGLDSSTIVALAEKLIKKQDISKVALGNKLKTFSSRSKNPEFDEGQYINKMIGEVNVEDHHVYPEGKEFWQDIDKVVFAQEEPFRSASIYSHWRIMKLASEEKIKVLLIGEGADEQMGYPDEIGSYFLHMLSCGKIATLCEELRAMGRIKGGGEVKKSLFYLFNQAARSLSPQALMLSLRKKSIGSLAYINPELFKKFHYNEEIPRGARANFQKFLHLGVTKFGLRGRLNFEDKNSMAFSIENRPPFLDYRLVEFVFSLPSVYKMHNGWNKYLLREGIKGLVPEDIRWRKDKGGFLTPALLLLKDNESSLRELFGGSGFRARDFVNGKMISDNFDRILSSQFEANPEIWRPISLELWLRKFF